jgi:hypothetical protein
MLKKQKADGKGFAINADFLMKLILSLVVAYVTLIVTTFKLDLSELKKEIKDGNDKFTEFVVDIKPKLAVLEEKITQHIEKGDKKN